MGDNGKKRKIEKEENVTCSNSFEYVIWTGNNFLYLLINTSLRCHDVMISSLPQNRLYEHFISIISLFKRYNLWNNQFKNYLHAMFSKHA